MAIHQRAHLHGGVEHLFGVIRKFAWAFLLEKSGIPDNDPQRLCVVRGRPAPGNWFLIRRQRADRHCLLPKPPPSGHLEWQPRLRSDHCQDIASLSSIPPRCSRPPAPGRLILDAHRHAQQVIHLDVSHLRHRQVMAHIVLNVRQAITLFSRRWFRPGWFPAGPGFRPAAWGPTRWLRQRSGVSFFSSYNKIETDSQSGFQWRCG